MKFGYFCNTTNWDHKPYNQLLDEVKEITSYCDENDWNSMLPMLISTVLRGGGVIFNCMGGCGRSGMVLLRLLLEMGWSSEGALERLREFRPCAIETEQQKFWAFK